VHSDGATDEQFFALLDIWTASGKWEGPGNPPGQAGCLVPLGIISKHNDRVRKRLERHRDREAAQARQSAADTALRDQLITATGGNIVRGPGIDDVSPIRAAMELVPIDRILSAIRSKVDKKMFPGNAPATSWREPRLLCEIANSYFRSIIQPRLVAAWSGAGKTAAPTVPILSPAGDMPDDIHELRSCHDQEHAPPGPHAMPQPDAAPDVPQEPVERAEPPAAVLAPLEPESASTAPQTNGSRPSDDSVAEPAPSDRSGNAQSTETTTTSPHPDTGGVNRTPSLDLPDGQVPEAGAPPVAEGRAAVLAAFARSRALASSQSAPPQPRPAVRQVERPPERQAEPISREGWEELVSGYVAGNVNWNPRRLGAPPGSPDCRAPRDVLRSFGL
jgi:hypothetical protein